MKPQTRLKRLLKTHKKMETMALKIFADFCQFPLAPCNPTDAAWVATDADFRCIGLEIFQLGGEVALQQGLEIIGRFADAQHREHVETLWQDLGRGQSDAHC
ncbi:MAG: hypothetical protein K2X44_01305 [Magnetospirillum sp.]|nr:hypothetical protein [Magnetospirillum sp.]